MISATNDNLRGVGDRALLLIAYYSMRRRSELVLLNMIDINIYEREHLNEMKICLRKNKTDQELQGRWTKTYTVMQYLEGKSSISLIFYDEFFA
jgi:site-specific recombinase XerC